MTTMFEPTFDPDTRFYWEGTQAGQLLIQRCTPCGTLRHPPSPACPACRSLDWTAEPAPTTGTLHSVAKVHHPPSPFQESPYLICLVDLAPGVRIATNLRDCDLEEAAIGMPVELFFEPAGEYQLPQFRPAR